MNTVLFITDDLMFPSRLRSLAQALELEVKVTSVAGLPSVSAAIVPLAIIDLTTTGSAVDEVVTSLKERWPEVRLVAFGPHVDVALLEQAQAAGCHSVLPRSQFSQQMGDILRLAHGDATD